LIHICKTIDHVVLSFNIKTHRYAWQTWTDSRNKST
jgi:hypothetical protein